jgi:hypothetical protein
MKPLIEVVQKLAHDKYHSYMQGGGVFYIDPLIPFIYEITPKTLDRLVHLEFNNVVKNCGKVS